MSTKELWKNTGSSCRSQIYCSSKAQLSRYSFTQVRFHLRKSIISVPLRTVIFKILHCWHWNYLPLSTVETPTERKFSSSQGAKPCRLTAILNAVPSEAVTARLASSGLLLTNTHWATEGQEEFQEHIFWERGMSSHQVYKSLQRSPPRFYELAISCRKKHEISINAPHITSQKEKRNHCNKNQRMDTYSLSAPKTRPFRLTTWTNILSSILYLLPKSSIHSYTWLFPQGGSGRKDKQPSLRPQTST